MEKVRGIQLHRKTSQQTENSVGQLQGRSFGFSKGREREMGSPWNSRT